MTSSNYITDGRLGYSSIDYGLDGFTMPVKQSLRSIFVVNQEISGPVWYNAEARWELCLHFSLVL
jgi:hypothetical protein